MYCYPTKRILRNVVNFFIVVSVNLSGLAQLDCPINTLIFPFQNENDAWDEYAWSSNLYTLSQMRGKLMDNHTTHELLFMSSDLHKTYPC